MPKCGIFSLTWHVVIPPSHWQSPLIMVPVCKHMVCRSPHCFLLLRITATTFILFYFIFDQGPSWATQPPRLSEFHKPTHVCTPSFSKRPLSSPSRDQSNVPHHKRQCSFQNKSQATGPATPFNTSHTNSFVLPVCAVCLGRHKHSMPVVQCPATRTWDNKFNTYCERVNKALKTREGGVTLCSLWQHDCSCRERHDYMHTCSRCGASTHGASRCPHAEKAPATDSI